MASPQAYRPASLDQLHGTNQNHPIVTRFFLLHLRAGRQAGTVGPSLDGYRICPYNNGWLSLDNLRLGDFWSPAVGLALFFYSLIVAPYLSPGGAYRCATFLGNAYRLNVGESELAAFRHENAKRCDVTTYIPRRPTLFRSQAVKGILV
jgi:hypothetical protein